MNEIPTTAPTAAAMDKKNFAAMIPPKGSNSDVSSSSSSANNNSSCKTPLSNKQDGVGWGLNPRGNGRRRGNPSLPRSNSANALSRCEPTGRKSFPQKKGVDKKPRARGSGSGELVIDKRNGPEIGSLQAPGAKKRDWDNLFYFAPRVSPNVWNNAHRGRNESGGGLFAKQSKFSKENFLRANCQFLVKADKDYEPYLADPDLLVDWNDVEQIVVTIIGEGASCPICLGAPIAAKMTLCGHIYCWSCILHYLALSDNASRPCPICYESIYSKDLKSVVAHVHYDVELGDIIDMELLRRHKDMRSVAPLHAHEATDKWNELYSKLLIISSNDVMEKVIDREHRELTACFEDDPDCPEVCFIHQAIRELTERKTALVRDETIEKECHFGIKEQDSIEVKDADSCPKIPDSPNSIKDEYFHFYQDCKGLNIFLHPLNFSMLAKEFGTDMISWPRYLSLRVIDKEYYSASEETRKRWKFLRHLPLSTPFIIVEVDLSEFVSKEVMAEFASQLRYRNTRRAQRANEEKKMEKIIAERERKLWNFSTAACPNFEPKLDFPEFLEPTACVFFPDVAAGVGNFSTDNKEGSLIGSPRTETLGGPSTTSFAQIASRAPMKKSPSYPMGGSITLDKASSHLQGTMTARRHSDSEPESDDHFAVPEFRASMSDAITKALEKIALEETNENNGQRKKKKSKGKVLFATGMGSFN